MSDSEVAQMIAEMIGAMVAYAVIPHAQETGQVEAVAAFMGVSPERARELLAEIEGYKGAAGCGVCAACRSANTSERGAR